jgi:hypothetical protein
VIVEAVGVGAYSLYPAGKPMAAAIQKAMVAAVVSAQAEGVTDPIELHDRMFAARDAVKSEWSAQG